MTCPVRAGAETDSAAASDMAALAAAPASSGDVAAATTATPVTPPPTKKTWKNTMFFGGGVGLGFGDVDYVSIEPLVGWHVHPKIAVGVSPIYRWTNDSRYPESVSTTNYGIRGFLQYYPVPNFFGEVEYEYLDYEYVLPTLDTARSTANNVFVGGGISRPLGGKAALFASALYNLSYDSNDPARAYDSPWVFSVGVAAGF
jgi:hypothetical protein